jgi:hypothetical protein
MNLEPLTLLTNILKNRIIGFWLYLEAVTKTETDMPCGRKRKRHKIATHKRKKRLRKNRHKKKGK